MKTPQEYIESHRNLKLNVYMFGKRVENVIDNPIIRPSLNAVAVTYSPFGFARWMLLTALCGNGPCTRHGNCRGRLSHRIDAIAQVRRRRSET